VIEYTVIFEPDESNWSAYVPDLPGYVAAAATREETEDLIREAIAFHIGLMREDGDTIPEPRTLASLVSVAA
jgi:predicted RNase H-like HicB family nuclease